MRIAFISYEFGEYSVRQASALAEEHDLLLVMPRCELDAFCGATGRAELYPFVPPRLRQPWSQLSSIRAIVRRIHAFRPDVIHFQNGHLWFNFALPWLRRYPLVVTIHDPRHHVGDEISRKTPQWVMDFGFRRADQVIVHGANLVPTVTAALGIPADRVHVVPHVAIGETYREVQEASATVDTPGDADGANTAHPPIPEERHTVLTFGRIWKYKGLDYLIQAEPLISQQIPDVKILIAGQGESFKRYRQMMVHPDRFEVHNRWIDDRERSEFFQRSAVVVLPYVEATQSGVVPVAYTYQKPVVATAVGGLPECVDHGETGLLVPPRDHRALAEAIVELISDDERRQRMGAAGYHKLCSQWSPDVVAARNVQVYRRAITDFRRRPTSVRTSRTGRVATGNTDIVRSRSRETSERTS